MKKPKTTLAYCFASGHIQFGTKLPKGALLIARGEDKKLRTFIETRARQSRVGSDIYVPGIPEAETQMAGLEALEAFVKWIREPAEKQGLKVIG